MLIDCHSSDATVVDAQQTMSDVQVPETGKEYTTLSSLVDTQFLSRQSERNLNYTASH